jgi:hypothetical protein
LPPALASKELRDEARLAIQGAEQVLDVEQPRLDLNDEEMLRLMPPNDVHRPTLSEVAEGVLDDYGPPRRAQQRNDSIGQLGMTGVEESSDLGGRHSRLELKLHADALGNGPH